MQVTRGPGSPRQGVGSLLPFLVLTSCAWGSQPDCRAQRGGHQLPCWFREAIFQGNAEAPCPLLVFAGNWLFGALAEMIIRTIQLQRNWGLS